MRIPLIAGNWKMYKTIAEALQFVEAVRDPLREYPGVGKAICAPSVALSPLQDVLRGTDIRLGAQNMHWEDQGAFTGEVSPLMLKSVVDFVIIGHSERRQFFGETDETVNKKSKAALAHSLIPIVCVGESLDQNRAGETASFVGGQVRAAFDGISPEQARGIVVAYEPIWAIGTGLAATADDANRIIGGAVRGTLASLYGDVIAQQMIIQYGGSIKPDNVLELMQQPEIDGGLVGGASLKPADYITLIRATAEAKNL
jgi:triosephosphate isomerase (TIM)